jgi:glycosyltransferase involved in cell wall biosynthesis
MDLSVVVPTINGRERIAGPLDALARADAKVVVVNGPSTDGTSGLVRDHPAVDRLVEVADRNVSAARNAGIAAAAGDAVAFLADGARPVRGWTDAVREALSDPDVDTVAGPVRGDGAAGAQRETVAGRAVAFFDGGNVAFSRETIEALDGFDEYLTAGGARDAAHRLAGLGRALAWRPSVAVRAGDGADRGDRFPDGESPWQVAYRTLCYRLVKNYGPRPGVAARVVRRAVGDGASVLREVVDGAEALSGWIGDGVDVVRSVAVGSSDGVRARRADPTPRRNPNGVSTR